MIKSIKEYAIINIKIPVEISSTFQVIGFLNIGINNLAPKPKLTNQTVEAKTVPRRKYIFTLFSIFAPIPPISKIVSR